MWNSLLIVAVSATDVSLFKQRLEEHWDMDTVHTTNPCFMILF